MGIRPYLYLILFAALSNCTGTTGSDRISFTAYAAGPSDIEFGQSLEFTSGRGFHIVLTKASLHIGALYLNQNRPISGAGSTACVLPGTYVAEVTRGREVDVLNSNPQIFPAAGEGTKTRALTGEIWVFGKSYDAEDDPTPLVEVAGSVHLNTEEYPFKARITIGKNRAIPPRDPAQPGTNPLCKLRIITPVPVNIVPSENGALLLRIDPRLWFANLDFSTLSNRDQPVEFPDTALDAASNALLAGVRSTLGTYSFQWLETNP